MVDSHKPVQQIERHGVKREDSSPVLSLTESPNEILHLLSYKDSDI